MQIINNIFEFDTDKKSAVAIGKFDGVHLGHQELLGRILSQKENGMQSVVFTFAPAPAVFFGFSDGKELTTKEEKRALFRKMGVDVLIEFPLNVRTAAIPAERFISDILVGKLNIGYVCAGVDLSFGDKGKGDSDLLRALAREHGYIAEIIEKVWYEGTEISSSYVRTELENGNIETATVLLGRNYSVEGYVVMGNQLGRTLGMPTVNLIPSEDKILPPCGVYYSLVIVEAAEESGNRCYCGITNIGYKPTVSDLCVLGVETYIYDFNSDLYDKKIRVELLAYKRKEMKFSGVDMLKAQIEKDIAEGRKYFFK